MPPSSDAWSGLSRLAPLSPLAGGDYSGAFLTRTCPDAAARCRDRIHLTTRGYRESRDYDVAPSGSLI